MARCVLLPWCAQVHLPSACSTELITQLVDYSLQRWGLQREDAEQLLEWSGGSPALFTTMARRWNPKGTPADKNNFLPTFMCSKMLEEVRTGCARAEVGRDCRRGL